MSRVFFWVNRNCPNCVCYSSCVLVCCVITTGTIRSSSQNKHVWTRSLTQFVIGCFYPRVSAIFDKRVRIDVCCAETIITMAKRLCESPVQRKRRNIQRSTRQSGRQIFSLRVAATRDRCSGIVECAIRTLTYRMGGNTNLCAMQV